MNKAQYSRTNYYKRKAEGRCISCGNPAEEKPDGGRYINCVRCRQRDKAKSRELKRELRIYRINMGLCITCGKRIPMENSKVCGVCAEQESEYKAYRSSQWKEEGKCPRCGRERLEGYLSCEKCHAWDIRHEQKRKAMRKSA